MFRFTRLCIALSSLILSAAPLQAGIVNIQSDGAGSTEGLGSFTGSLNYSAVDASTGMLTVKLTNTSSAGNGGYITAFAFNNPLDLITAATMTTNTNLSTLLGGPTYHDGISTPPFSSMDIGASLSGSWLGQGNPNSGIGVGSSGTFTFTLTGTKMNTLTTQSFVDADCDEEFFLVRFRGFSNGGSDKVPGELGGITPVPEASSAALAAFGMIGLTALVRRAKRRKERAPGL